MSDIIITRRCTAERDSHNLFYSMHMSLIHLLIRVWNKKVLIKKGDIIYEKRVSKGMLKSFSARG
jgi:hypothetical protein